MVDCLSNYIHTMKNEKKVWGFAERLVDSLDAYPWRALLCIAVIVALWVFAISE